MTTQTDDELLSAYIDGELALAETERLTARLAAEPALAARLERMRKGDEQTRQLYASLDQRPIPRAVLDLLEAGPAETPSTGTVVSLAPRRPAVFSMPVALAASVALLAGLFLGELFSGTPGVPQADLMAGDIAPSTELHSLLESAPSAATVEFDDGSKGMVVLSLADADGSFCRQFDLDRQDRSVQGLACRGDAGWQLETVAYGPARQGGYQQASSAAAAAVAAAVDARLGDADPLGADEESVLISTGWKKSP